MDEKKLATLWCASNVSSSKWIGLPMPHEGVCEASVCGVCEASVCLTKVCVRHRYAY